MKGMYQLMEFTTKQSTPIIKNERNQRSWNSSNSIIDSSRFLRLLNILKGFQYFWSISINACHSPNFFLILKKDF